MTLSYLIFDHSEDTESIGTFDAMATVSTQHLAAVLAEVTLVLDWALQAFPDEHGPLDQGFAWDHHLHEHLEADGLHTVNLLLSGAQAFCSAFAHRFCED